jgi:hypothetical protein
MKKSVIVALVTSSVLVIVLIVALIFLLRKKKDQTENPKVTFYSGPNQTGESFEMNGAEGEYSLSSVGVLSRDGQIVLAGEAVDLPFTPESATLPDGYDLCLVNKTETGDALGVCLEDFGDEEVVAACADDVFSEECMKPDTKTSGDVTSLVVVPKEPRQFVFYSDVDRQGTEFVVAGPGVYISNPDAEDVGTALTFIPKSAKIPKGYSLLFTPPGAIGATVYRFSGFPPPACSKNFFTSTIPMCATTAFDEAGRYVFEIVEDKFTMPQNTRLKDLPFARSKMPDLPTPDPRKRNRGRQQ